MTYYRRAPRSLEHALDELSDELAPATLLGDIQRVWSATVGPAIAAQAQPTAERGGVVTVSCAASVWAQELDLMAPQIIDRLNAALGERIRSEAALRGRRPPALSTACGGTCFMPNLQGKTSTSRPRFRPELVLSSCIQILDVPARLAWRGHRDVPTSSEDRWRTTKPRGQTRPIHPVTTPRTSPSSKVSRQCASVRACTSAPPGSAVCTTSSTRSSTTPSTRRWPATARRRRSRSIPTTR